MLYKKIRNRRFTFNNIFSLENRVIYEIEWKNIAERVRTQETVRRKPIVYRIPGGYKYTHRIYNSYYYFHSCGAYG